MTVAAVVTWVYFVNLSDSDDPSFHLSDCDSDSDVVSDGVSPLPGDSMSVDEEIDGNQASKSTGSSVNYLVWTNITGKKW